MTRHYEGPARPRHRTAWIFAGTAALGSLLHSAIAGPPADTPHIDTPSVTVVGQRERELAERHIRAFVSDIAVAPFRESLARWGTPICPAVAGLPRDEGEFILQRLTQIAAAAGAPLAPEHCKGNFVVIVAANPDDLLKQWSKRNPTLFGDGPMFKVRRFLSASGAVRVWYNTSIAAADGQSTSIGSPAMGLSGSSPSGAQAFAGIPQNSHAQGSRLAFDDVRNLGSALVVVDGPRAKGCNFGQLAAYIAMVGFAEIRAGAAAENAPTILHLFSEPKDSSPPLGLSPWDQAFLKALYQTEQSSKMQLAEIKTSVLKDVLP
jgi:hypothetical protein